MLRNLLALRQIAQRTISTTSRRHFENKVPEKQKLFQEDNGMPVHLKGGASDALLYRATMALTLGGCISQEAELTSSSQSSHGSVSFKARWTGNLMRN